MGLSTRILLRLALAAALLPLAVGSIYHAERRSATLHEAQTELRFAAERFTHAIDLRLSSHEALLGAVLTDAELLNPFALAGGASTPATASAALLRTARHVLASVPEAIAFELHARDGAPLVGIARDGRTTTPGAAEGAWLERALASGSAVARWQEHGPDGPVVLRLAVARPEGATTAPEADAPVVSLVANLADLCRPALAVAVGERGPLALVLSGRPGEPDCELASLPPGDAAAPLVARARFPRHGGEIELRRSREQVLAGLLHFERTVLFAFGLVIGAVGLLIWSSLRATVLVPLRDTLGLVSAFESGSELPPPRARPAARELATLDVALRKAMLGFRESLRHGERLNAELEHRVNERTLALLRQTRELRAAHDEARAAVRARSDFVAAVSHELRTPLNGIMGLSDLLLEGRLEPAQRDCAETLRGATESLLGIVNGILDFSRLEAGGVQLEEVEFDMGDLVEDTADLLAPMAHARGLALHVVIDPTCPVSLRGDPLRVRQVLTNLVGNAVKFTEHGEVVVRVRAEALPPRPPGADGARLVTLVFEVEDTGAGMEPATLGRLFQPFVQAEAGTARRFGGTGLGLAISRRLVEQMGGAIGATSDPGRGSRFWFRLPLALASPVPRPAARPSGFTDPQLATLSGRAVLVVDGHGTGRELLSRYLSAWGAVVHAAPTVPEALDLARRAAERGLPISLALVDEAGPGSAGPGARKRLFDDPTLARVPLVKLARPDPLADGTFDTSGVACALVHKPVRRRPLLSACLLALGQHAPATASPEGAPPQPVGTSDDRAVEPPRPRAPARPRILLAEDNALNRKLLVRQLDLLGFDCETVTDGRAAVQVCAHGGHVAVLMDLNLPVMDGRAAAAAIRAAETPCRRVPILAITAHAEPRVAELARAAGMNECLVKPLRRHELGAALARHLGPACGLGPPLSRTDPVPAAGPCPVSPADLRKESP